MAMKKVAVANAAQDSTRKDYTGQNQAFRQYFYDELEIMTEDEKNQMSAYMHMSAEKKTIVKAEMYSLLVDFIKKKIYTLTQGNVSRRHEPEDMVQECLEFCLEKLPGYMPTFAPTTYFGAYVEERIRKLLYDSANFSEHYGKSFNVMKRELLKAGVIRSGTIEEILSIPAKTVANISGVHLATIREIFNELSRHATLMDEDAWVNTIDPLGVNPEKRVIQAELSEALLKEMNKLTPLQQAIIYNIADVPEDSKADKSFVESLNARFGEEECFRRFGVTKLTSDLVKSEREKARRQLRSSKSLIPYADHTRKDELIQAVDEDDLVNQAVEVSDIHDAIIMGALILH